MLGSGDYRVPRRLSEKALSCRKPPTELVDNFVQKPDGKVRQGAPNLQPIRTISV
jgi:hypothetical protein